jgi:hypothetical protein
MVEQKAQEGSTGAWRQTPPSSVDACARSGAVLFPRNFTGKRGLTVSGCVVKFSFALHQTPVAFVPARRFPSATESAYSHRRMSLNGWAGLSSFLWILDTLKADQRKALRGHKLRLVFLQRYFAFLAISECCRSPTNGRRRRFSLCGLRSTILAHTQNLAVAVSPGVITGVPRLLLGNPLRTRNEASGPNSSSDITDF